MNRTAVAAPQIRAPNERARSIDAALDASMYPQAGGITLWRASQLARGRISTVDTGYPVLSVELPGGGWPVGGLAELLTQNHGCGEMRVLAPALAKLKAPILLINPPAEPSAHGLAYAGIQSERLMMIRAPHTGDQLWSAEQALRAGTCAAVMVWLRHPRADALRRLHLASREGTALFFVMRHLNEAQDASPAELRIAVRPSETGANVEILKRKGPRFEGSLDLNLATGVTLLSPRGRARRGTTRVARDTVVPDFEHID